MTELSNEIISSIKEAKTNYIEKNYHSPSIIIINPYVAAAIKDYEGMKDVADLKRFDGMMVAYIMDNDAEEFQLI